MRTTRTITVALAAALGAAALAGPAAAVPADATHTTSTPWYAGKSTIQASQRSTSSQDLRTPDAVDAATANVYVPPAELSPSRATTAVAPPPTWPTNPQPIGQADTTANAPSSGFDWDAAGLGAGAAAAAFAIALAGTAGVRRRRTTRHRSVATP
jgi:hypothetical protein